MTHTVLRAKFTLFLPDFDPHFQKRQQLQSMRFYTQYFCAYNPAADGVSKIVRYLAWD